MWKAAYKIYGTKFQRDASRVSAKVGGFAFGVALESLEYVADRINEKNKLSKWRHRCCVRDYNNSVQFVVPIICAFVETLNAAADGSLSDEISALHDMVKKGMFGKYANFISGRHSSRN